MFICSLRASKIKFLLSAIVCAAIVVSVIVFLPDSEHTVTVNGTQYDSKIKFDGIKSEEDVRMFASGLGYVLEEAPIEHYEVKIPSKMDAVLEKYNDLQKSQGFNLAKYKNKTVHRYTYIVKGLPGEEKLPEKDVLLTIIVYKDKVVGGDLFYEGTEVKPFLAI